MYNIQQYILDMSVVLLLRGSNGVFLNEQDV